MQLTWGSFGVMGLGCVSGALLVLACSAKNGESASEIAQAQSKGVESVETDAVSADAGRGSVRDAAREAAADAAPPKKVCTGKPGGDQYTERSGPRRATGAYAFQCNPDRTPVWEKAADIAAIVRKLCRQKLRPTVQKCASGGCKVPNANERENFCRTTATASAAGETFGTQTTTLPKDPLPGSPLMCTTSIDCTATSVTTVTTCECRSVYIADEGVCAPDTIGNLLPDGTTDLGGGDIEGERPEVCEPVVEMLPDVGVVVVEAQTEARALPETQ